MTAERQSELGSVAETLADVWFEYDSGPAFEKEKTTPTGIAKTLIRDAFEQENFRRTCDIALAEIAADEEETSFLAAKVAALVAEGSWDDPDVLKAWRL